MSDEAATPRLTAEEPWPGLLAFSENNQDYFKGRSADAEELAQLLRRDTLTALTGQSGLGKTSLLHAGLFPLLRPADYLPVYVRLDFAETSPDFVEQLRRRIATEVAERKVQAPQPDPKKSLWEYFHERGAAFWSPRNRLLTPVLVLDQFEELFTLVGQSRLLDKRRDELLQALAELVCNRPPEALLEQLNREPGRAERYEFERVGYKMVLSLREDFLPEFESRLKPLFGLPLRNHKRLVRMNGSEALQVVAEAGQAVVAPEAAEPIVRFVAGGRSELRKPAAERLDLARLEVEPALLSLVCSELNQQREPGARITPNLLEAEEENIIAGFYQRSLSDLGPQVQVFVEDQLLTAAGYRDTCAWDDALALPGVDRTTLEMLVKRRILRKEERFGTLRVELTHDLLTPVIRRSRDERQTREARVRVEDQARRAEQRIAVEQLARRRWRLAFGAMTLLMLGAVFFAWRSIEAGRTAAAEGRMVFSQQLVVHVRELFANEPDLAWLVASEAYHHPGSDRHNPEARRLLIDSDFLVPQYLRRYFERRAGETMEIKGFALSPDGRLLAGADGAGRVQRWNMESGRLQAVGAEDHRGPVNSVAFSPDGQRIAAAGKNGSVRVLDAATGLRVGEPLVEHSGAVLAVAFGNDGTRLFSAGEDGQVFGWQLGTEPAKRRLLESHEAPVTQLVADARGLRLAWCSGRQVVVWDPAAGRRVAAFAMDRPVGLLAISPNGTELAIATTDGRLRLLPTLQGGSKPVVQAREMNRLELVSLAYSSDGQILATRGRDGAIRLTQTRDLAQVLMLSAPAPGAAAPLAGYALQFSANGETLLSAHQGGAVVEWSTAQRPTAPRLLADPSVRFAHAAYAADGRLATAGHQKIVLWDARSGRRLREWSIGSDAPFVSAMAFHPRDGKLIVLARRTEGATASDEGRMLLLDPRGPSTRTVRLEGPADALAFDPRSGEIVIHAGGELVFFDVEGQLIKGRDPLRRGSRYDRLLGLAFRDDATLLAIGRDSLEAWKDSKPVFAPRHDRPGPRLTDRWMLLALAPDGKTMAVQPWNRLGRIELRETDSNRRIGWIPLGRSSGVERLVFSPDGQHLAWLDTRKRIVLWDRSRRREIGEPFAAHGYDDLKDVQSLVFSPAGDQLLAVGGSVLLADVQQESVDFNACERAQRNMTVKEWEFFMGDQPYRRTCDAYPPGAPERPAR